MILKLIFTILTFLILSSAPHNLRACSCIGQRTVQEEIKNVDAVLVGMILAKETITLTDSTAMRMFPNDTAFKNSSLSKKTIVRYDLLVQDIYKGKLTKDTVTIYTGNGGGDCGIRFEIGKKYIIYGEKESYFGQENNDFKFPESTNSFWTYICLRTTSYYQDEIIEIEKFAKKGR